MRWGQRKSRAARLVVGAAIFGGLYFADWMAIPQSQPQPALETLARQTPAAPFAESTAIATAASETTHPQPPPAAFIEARPGDTPLKLLARVGVGPEDAQEAVRMLARVRNPRDLRPGQQAAVLTQSDRLLSFRLALAPDRDIVIARDHTGGFVVEDQNRPTSEIAT